MKQKWQWKSDSKFLVIGGVWFILNVSAIVFIGYKLLRHILR